MNDQAIADIQSAELAALRHAAWLQTPQNKNKRILTPMFQTWEAFIKQLEKPIVRGQPSYSQSQDNISYYGGVGSLEECLSMARNGWPEGRTKIAKLKGQVDNLITGGRTAFVDQRFTEAGDDVDVGRYLIGEPENMIEYPQREFTGGKGGRVVRLLINVTSSYSVGSEYAFTRGAVAMALIDMLEQEGYRVELWVGEVGIEKTTNIFIRTCIKRAQEDYNMDVVAFATCHPVVQRRMFFRIYEQQPINVWPVENWSYGNGGSFDDPDPEVIEFGLCWHIDQGGRLHDPGGLITAINKVLQQFNITVESTTTK